MRARLRVLLWVNVAALYRMLPRSRPIEYDWRYGRICDRLEDALRRLR